MSFNTQIQTVRASFLTFFLNDKSNADMSEPDSGKEPINDSYDNQKNNSQKSLS